MNKTDDWIYFLLCKFKWESTLMASTFTAWESAAIKTYIIFFRSLNYAIPSTP
jgi:hypothetical protein